MADLEKMLSEILEMGRVFRGDPLVTIGRCEDEGDWYVVYGDDNQYSPTLDEAVAQAHAQSKEALEEFQVTIGKILEDLTPPSTEEGEAVSAETITSEPSR